MRKKVLFVSAVTPYLKSENHSRPLWPAFLAAYAEKQLGNHEFDFRYGTGEIERLLTDIAPDILCISSVTQNFEYAEKYAACARAKKIPVIVGGMHISSLPTSLSVDMDVACIGEGEQTFVNLLTSYYDKGAFRAQELAKIPGVGFHDGDRVITTPVRTERPEIDALPHPKRSIIGYGRRGYVYTARGCPYTCVFCSCTRFWGKVRYASPEYIIEELGELIDHGAKVVRFADENFVANKARLKDLARLIDTEGINKKLKFSCWCRANNVTLEIVDMLKTINVVSVKLGLESGNDRVLDYLKGNVSVEDNRRAVQLLSNAGFQVNADFLFGAPDETEQEMADTYKFIKRSPIAFFDIDIFSALPGTPVWELAEKKGLVSNTRMEWSRLNYKFIDDPKRSITLSEKLTHSELSKIHAKFQRLRFWKSLIAIPRSPWLSEIPLIALKKAIDLFMIKILRKRP
ncbi:MAG TPA: radical SAM protein [Chitinispirillaceae bacterium]|nr:radical SAM protein [Chitinispirillaceae bacterium]